jgi:gas vesicle protein
MNNDHKDNRFWFGFFIGGLIGAGIIVLLGTKELKKIEKLLEKKGKEAIGDLEKKVEDLKEKGEELIQKGEILKDQVVEQVIEKKDELTEVATEKLENTLSHIELIQQQGLQNTQKLRRAFKNLPKKK